MRQTIPPNRTQSEKRLVCAMHGPVFLLFYGSVIAATFIACWVATKRSDNTASMPPMPIPAQPDPYETAYLRSGEEEVARVALIALIERGYLRVTGASKTSVLLSSKEYVFQPPGHPDARHLSELEREVYEWFSSSKPIHEVLRGDGLPAQIATHCAHYSGHLERNELLSPSGTESFDWRMLITGAAVIVGLGGYKFFVAVAKGRHNTDFLIMMVISGLWLLPMFCRAHRLTNRGRSYLQGLELAYSQLKGRLPARAPALPDPMLPIVLGIFGLGALAGTAYAQYEKMLQKPTVSASAGGNGSRWANWFSFGEGCGSCGGEGCGGGCGGCGG